MESQLFPGARERFATRQLSWLEGDIRAVMLPPGVVFDFSEETLADIPVGSRISTSDPLTNRTATGGILSADPVRFPAVDDTRLVAQVVFYVDTGVESTSILIAYFGDEGLQGDPFVPMGVDYYLYPDAAFGGFLRL